MKVNAIDGMLLQRGARAIKPVVFRISQRNHILRSRQHRRGKASLRRTLKSAALQATHVLRSAFGHI
ncbi:MAG: hypothetical protein CTY20_10610 [Hyphomicrobium sp.]|nr:MAG: hypothetical protein CTY20_10610 [Hyphomicrobium sp.]